MSRFDIKYIFCINALNNYIIINQIFYYLILIDYKFGSQNIRLNILFIFIDFINQIFEIWKTILKQYRYNIANYRKKIIESNYFKIIVFFSRNIIESSNDKQI